MDWENKFYSIVKDTENNLAKAKLQEKLCGKSCVSSSDDLSQRMLNSYSQHYRHNCDAASIQDTFGLGTNSAHDKQICHMQEQINHQNKAIENLQKLVISLNKEKDCYKEQISSLKDEVHGLTCRMGKQFGIASSERNMSSMKQELMHEIDKVKGMLQKFTEEATSSRRSSSPHWSDDFWTVKENLSTSLELIHQEMKTVNTRIDKIESKLEASTHDRFESQPLNKDLHALSQYQRSPLLYTAASVGTEHLDSFGLQQLRLTVNSLNSKLDNLERRVAISQTQQTMPHSQNWLNSPTESNMSFRKRGSALLEASDNDRESFSDLSNISSVSWNNTDDEIDALTRELQDSSTLRPQRVNFRSRLDASTTGKVDLSLSDTDSNVDLEADSLDLDD